VSSSGGVGPRGATIPLDFELPPGGVRTLGCLEAIGGGVDGELRPKEVWPTGAEAAKEDLGDLGGLAWRGVEPADLAGFLGDPIGSSDLHAPRSSLRGLGVRPLDQSLGEAVNTSDWPALNKLRGRFGSVSFIPGLRISDRCDLFTSETLPVEDTEAQLSPAKGPRGWCLLPTKRAPTEDRARLLVHGVEDCTRDGFSM